jgi:hypothetical protein
MLNVIPFVTQITSWIMRLWDEWVINAGFDRSCRGINNQARRVSEAHTGRIQSYLQVIAVGFIILAIFWVWGGEG